MFRNVKTKSRALDEYADKTKGDDVVWLLNQIRGVMHQFDTKQNSFFSTHDARSALMNCTQAPTQSNADYMDQFRAFVEVLEYIGATVSESPSLLPRALFATQPATVQTKAAHDYTLAALFLRNSDPGRYGSLLARPRESVQSW